MAASNKVQKAKAASANKVQEPSTRLQLMGNIEPNIRATNAEAVPVQGSQNIGTAQLLPPGSLFPAKPLLPTGDNPSSSNSMFDATNPTPDVFTPALPLPPVTAIPPPMPDTVEGLNLLPSRDTPRSIYAGRNGKIQPIRNMKSSRDRSSQASLNEKIRVELRPEVRPNAILDDKSVTFAERWNPADSDTERTTRKVRKDGNVTKEDMEEEVVEIRGKISKKSAEKRRKLYEDREDQGIFSVQLKERFDEEERRRAQEKEIEEKRRAYEEETQQNFEQTQEEEEEL